MIVAGQFTRVNKAFIKKNLQGRRQVLGGHGLTHLRRMHHWRMKHTVIGQQPIKTRNVAVPSNLMPNSKRIYRHKIILNLPIGLCH